MNQSSIFTLEKNAKGYKDFDEFPDHIYVDTSAWICAYGSQNTESIHNGNTKNRGIEVSGFMSDCLEKGTQLYHSGLVLSEVTHANKRAHYDFVVSNQTIDIPKHSSGSINYKKLNEVICLEHPEIIDEIEKDKNAIIKLIKCSSTMLEYEDDEEFFYDIENIIKSTNGLLDTQDAKHTCIARTYSINSFLTADKDFIYLDNNNIFVPRDSRYYKEKIGRANVILEFNKNEY